MAYQLLRILRLPALYAGVPIEIQFKNVDNSNNGSAITTGITEVRPATFAFNYANYDPTFVGYATIQKRSDHSIISAFSINTQDAGGGGGGGSAPTVDQIATRLLTNPANKLLTDSSGNVTSTNSSTAPTVDQIATRLLITPANKLATDASGNVTPVGGSSAPTVDQIATRLLLSPANKLATDGSGNVNTANPSISRNVSFAAE